jgi:hypothetical protein
MALLDLYAATGKQEWLTRAARRGRIVPDFGHAGAGGFSGGK